MNPVEKKNAVPENKGDAHEVGMFIPCPSLNLEARVQSAGKQTE
jgi:hypothetical protein